MNRSRCKKILYWFLCRVLHRHLLVITIGELTKGEDPTEGSYTRVKHCIRCDHVESEWETKVTGLFTE